MKKGHIKLIGAGLAVGLLSSVALVMNRATEKAAVPGSGGPVTLDASTDGGTNSGKVAPPYPVFPHGNTLTQSLPENSPDTKMFVDFYNEHINKPGQKNASLPMLSRSKLAALPPRYLDIAGNRPNPASGQSDSSFVFNPATEQFASSLLCQQCHDSDWLAAEKDLPKMTFWEQSSVSVTSDNPSPSDAGDAGQDARLAANWSPFWDWSGSIKALAGRDPVFLAQVENTRNLSPNQPEQVDNLCLRCHSPLGHQQAAKDKLPYYSHYMLYSTPANSGYQNPLPNEQYTQAQYAVYGALGRDGISCSACHSVLTSPGPSWDGKDYSLFYGSDSLYGSNISDRLRTENKDPTKPPSFPFTSSAALVPNSIVGPDTGLTIAPMNAAGLDLQPATNTPDTGQSYLRDSIVCGSCHVVILPKVPENYSAQLQLKDMQSRPGYTKPPSCPDTQTNFTGDFLTDPCVGLAYEQTTYFEWLNSGYAPAISTCQTCHMPTTLVPDHPDRYTAVAQINEDLMKFYGSQLTTLPRRPYNRHTLLGINLFVHEMFQQFSDVLGVLFYKDANSVIPPYLQSPSALNSTGNLVPNPGAETGKAEGWKLENSGSSIEAKQSAPSGNASIMPATGSYFFSVKKAVHLNIDVTPYAEIIDKGQVKVLWGASAVCPVFQCTANVFQYADVKGDRQTGDSTSLTFPQARTVDWVTEERNDPIYVAKGTRVLQLQVFPAGDLTGYFDNLWLYLQFPDGTVPQLKDATRSYEIAPNLLNAEQSILDLAVNTSQGEFNTGNPAVKVTLGTPTEGKISTNVPVLNIPVTVASNVGHKFPSGAGFRRAFLQLEVLDSNGKTIWASGQPNQWGAICNGVCASDGSNTLDSEFTHGDDYKKSQPHFQVITEQKHVQIYEERVVNDNNKVTAAELQRFKVVKDNRILPNGWRPPATRDPSQELFGLNLQQIAMLTMPLSILGGPNDTTITSDPDYTPPNNAATSGKDNLTYQIPLSQLSGWKSVRVRVNYQTIPPGYLAARFSEGLHDEKGGIVDPGPAMQRLIYMTSHLNMKGMTEKGLKFAPDPKKPNQNIEFVSNWTMVLSQDEYLPQN
jgi:hypothetical protein